MSGAVPRATVSCTERERESKKDCRRSFLVLLPFNLAALLRSFAVDILLRLVSASSQMSDVDSESLSSQIAATLSGSSVGAAPTDCHSSVDTTLPGSCWR